VNKKSKQAVIYSLDTSCLIHAWRRAYPLRNFPPFWDKLDELIADGRLFSSAEVLKEIKRKDDELYDWCKPRSDVFLAIDDDIQDHVIEIMRDYPKLVDTSKGRSGADPFVISLARMNGNGWVVLSEENPGKQASPKIPDVCSAEGIRCVRLVELIQDEDWIFR
jgi:Domain of unknown function (DUF4411)